MKIYEFEKEIEISVPPNKEWKNYFVFGIGGFFVIPVFLFTIYLLFDSLINWNINAKTIENLIVILASFLIVNYSLWLLIGNEKVVFKENIMEFKITNGIFSTKEKIEINQIKNLKTSDKVYNSNLPFIKDSGRIKFEYKGKYFSILRGLKDNEIQEVAEIFKNQIIKIKI